jgi:hypothetical protein
MLEEQSALKELATMQARTQDEMSIEERTRLTKKRKQIVAHGVNLARSVADGFGASRVTIVRQGDDFNLDPGIFR